MPTTLHPTTQAVAALLLASLFTGCAPMRPQGLPQADACFNALHYDPAFASFYTRYPFDARTLSIEAQSDPTYVTTDEERRLISSFSAIVKRCTNLALSEVGPTFDQGPYIRLASTRDQVLVALYQGRITFGQANTARSLANAQFRETVATYRAQANQQEEAARQAAILAILNRTPPPAYQLPPPPTPVQTICNRAGNQTICTSR